MFTAECPSCGAKVSLRASASTTAVCAFCRSTLVRRADALERIGVQGELLEDYARVQIGTGGTFEGRDFSAVGRIQLRDEAGAWNEWYVLFDDGTTGWLSEASGQYAVTFDRGKAPGVGAFDALLPGRPVTIAGESWSVTDRRIAHCTAAEGELPFPVDSRWEAKVVDLRRDERLVTLDWSDGDPPTLYVGRALALEALSPTLLRSLAVVEDTAGALEGGLQSLACPSCGASVRYVPKLAVNVTCRQCKSELTGRSEGLIVEVERADRAERPTWLALGDACERDANRWTVIGILARRTAEAPQEWTEYLLFSPKGGFRWIVHAAGRFQWVEVLNEAPEVVGSSARLRDESYTRSDAYDSITTWVAGSFNWRPKVGDRAQVSEFIRGACLARRTLTQERSQTEVTWSLAAEAPAEPLAAAFGKVVVPGSAAAVPVTSSAAATGAKRGIRDLAVIFTIVLTVLSLPAFFIDEDEMILPAIIAVIALWAPLRLERDSDD